MGKKLKARLNNPSLLNSLTKDDEAIQVIIEILRRKTRHLTEAEGCPMRTDRTSFQAPSEK
jgi:hypothetical protein